MDCTVNTCLETWREEELTPSLSMLSVANIFCFLHFQEVPACLFYDKQIFILVAHQRSLFVLRWDKEFI